MTTTASLFWLLALREWRHHPWRHGVALLAVALGVALAYSVHLINQSALADGSYRFNGIGPGSYHVSLIGQDGWTATTPVVVVFPMTSGLQADAGLVVRGARRVGEQVGGEARGEEGGVADLLQGHDVQRQLRTPGQDVRQLAQELGCSAMTPYRYFRDKNEILAAVTAAGLVVGPGLWAWFGGGADLNPPLPYAEDTEQFHAAMRAACAVGRPAI